MEKILTLPVPVIIEIALDLDLKILSKICTSDKKFNKLTCNNPYFWIQKDFDVDYTEDMGSPKTLYSSKRKKRDKIIIRMSKLAEDRVLDASRYTKEGENMISTRIPGAKSKKIQVPGLLIVSSNRKNLKFALEDMGYSPRQVEEFLKLWDEKMEIWERNRAQQN